MFDSLVTFCLTTCRRVLAALGVAVLVLAGVGIYWYTRLDDEVRTRVEALLAAQYPDLEVSVAAARLVPDQGIEIRGVALREPNQPGPRAVLLEVDEIFLHCTTDLTELAQGKLEMTQIRVLRPTLTATLRPDSSWSLSRLFPLPNLGGEPVPASVVGGRVRVFDPISNPSRTYLLRDIQAKLAPEEKGRGAEPALRPGTKASPVPPARLRIVGSAQADYLRRLEFDVRLDPTQESSWHVHTRAAGIDFSPEFVAQLPAPLADRLSPWLQLRARIDLSAAVTSTSPREPWTYQLDAEFAQGSWSDPRAPLPLSNLRGQLRIDNSGWQVTHVTAESGAASVALAARSTGISPQSPHVVDLQIRNWQLEPAMLSGLPPESRAVWDLFQPAGVIDVAGRLHFDGRHWRPDVRLDCREISFAWRDFPYRLERGTGSVQFREQTLNVALTAFAGTQPVQITCQATDPGPRWVGTATLETAGPVAVDGRLVGALPPAMQPHFQAFRPRGALTLRSRFDKPGPDLPLRTSLVVGLVDGEICYRDFPYPLRELTGQVELRDGVWLFHNLSARNDSGRVTCSGRWVDRPGGGELALDLTATDVPLEDELRDALPASAWQAWNELQPRGTLDHLAVALRYRAGEPQAQVVVRAQKWPQPQNVPGRALALVPQAFPYRLDDVTGELEYREGTIELHNLRARHGNTQWSAQGLASPTPQGRTRLRLAQLAVDRLTLDGDFLQALPPVLRDGLARLALTGQLHLRGGIDWVFDPAANALRRAAPNAAGVPAAGALASWDLQADLDGGSLHVGLPLEHVYGSVRLIGASQGANFSTRGELAIDSLLCHGVQVTQIAGPLWIDNGVVAVGAWAHRGEAAQLPRQVSGKLFGGTLAGNAQIGLATGQFQTELTLTDANLATVAGELVPAQRNFRGRLFAGLQLAGAGTSVESWRGRGNIRLRDADVYELPVMLSMLKVLRVKAPDKTAFTHADAEFEVVGPRLGFSKIDFEGDAITLRGQGEVTLDRSVNLTFHSIVGRTDEQFPYLFPVLGEASRQILEIRVTGSLENPQVDSKAFPALKETLEKIFPDLYRERANPWLPASGPLGIRPKREAGERR